jgi:activator of HSP90 ATPase
MTPVIQQSVEFDVSPEVLYELYIDSKKHWQATGAPAKMSRQVGGAFTAFGGQLKGKNLLLVPNKMIVQTWRAAGWKNTDADSILVISFSKTKTGARVDPVQVNVPEYDHQGVTDGWHHYYWEPWRVYLEAVRLEKKAERRKARQKKG